MHGIKRYGKVQNNTYYWGVTGNNFQSTNSWEQYNELNTIYYYLVMG